MDTTIPIIPTIAWLLAVAIGTTVLIIVLLLYLFNHRRISIITDLGGTVADLMAKKELLKADYEAVRDHIRAQKEELLRVDGERAEHEKLRLELDELTRKVQAMDSQNQALRDEVGQLELEKYQHTEKVRQTAEEMQVVTHQRDAAAEELKTLQEEIAKRRQENTQELSRIEKEHKNAVEERIKALDEKLRQKKEAAIAQMQEYNMSKARLEETEARQQDLRGKIADVEARLQSLGAECVNKESRLTELHAEIKAMQCRKIELGKEMETLNSGIEELRQAREQLSEIAEKVASLEKKERSLKDACAQQEGLLKQVAETVNHKMAELAEVEKQLRDFAPKYAKQLQAEEKQAELERSVIRLEIEENRLLSRVNELHKKLDQEDSGKTENATKSFNDLLVEPACLKPEEFLAKPLQKMDEVLALQKFKDQLAREGLIFSDRVVNSFHTSLKCADINPLTVLAGVSGTGKTLLPIKYARLMGMHLLVIAVQPRWDSPQDMFGFYNYMEKQYNATEMAQALVRMDEYHPFMGLGGVSKDRMLMVLMDEMNLARTEYYFSEFLSKLELRRDVKDPSDPSDRKRAEIVLDLGPGGAEASRLWVGGNLLFVGTMNEDETTQSLSDKVLDRSNVLRFGKPASRLLKNSDNHEPEKANGFLTHELWKNWITPYDVQSPWSSQIAGWTEEINVALEKIGRPFGYRVEKAILAYVANYPRLGTGEVYKLAFADQIEQKILPKLRGLDVSDPHAADCLTQIQDIIVELGDRELTDAFNEAKEKSNTNLFLWHGVSRS